MAELEIEKPPCDYNDEQNQDNLATQKLDVTKPRKAVFRRTIDYFASTGVYLNEVICRPSWSRRRHIQPDVMYQHYLTPPIDYNDNPMNCVCTKHIRTSTNKNKCPIYVVCWTPDGRRLITGASSGEFTLWNGLTFNFETILQAHDTHIRTMKWSYNEEWLLSADDTGMVKYWQANMNDVNVFQAHKDSVRGLSFSPTDEKFATCSNDNTVRIFDFKTNIEERVLRGHGGEARCVAWHPTKSLVISGSKDSQQPIKLWDPKGGNNLSTLYVHKSTVTDIAINDNGNWFLSASKDHYIKLFDLRNLKSELQVFRGHKKDVIRVAWHPIHEQLFASGSGDGALMFWMANPAQVDNQHYQYQQHQNNTSQMTMSSYSTDSNEVGLVDDAHENIIWSIDWHPLGHLLATGSNDFATKFWTRHRPGDLLRDTSNNNQVNTTGETKVTHPNLNDDDDVVDLHKLTSSIQADLDKSEALPGLLKNNNDYRDDDYDGVDSDGNESGVTEDSKMNAEQKANRGGVTRAVPRRFAELWADKNSRALAVQMNSVDEVSGEFTGAKDEVHVMTAPPGSDKPVFRGRAPTMEETSRRTVDMGPIAPALAAPVRMVPPPPAQTSILRITEGGEITERTEDIPIYRPPHVAPIPSVPVSYNERPAHVPPMPPQAPPQINVPMIRPSNQHPLPPPPISQSHQPQNYMPPQAQHRPVLPPPSHQGHNHMHPIRNIAPPMRPNQNPRFGQPIRMPPPPINQSENPFEPQSDTGSSLTYIPIPNDDGVSRNGRGGGYNNFGHQVRHRFKQEEDYGPIKEEPSTYHGFEDDRDDYGEDYRWNTESNWHSRGGSGGGGGGGYKRQSNNHMDGPSHQRGRYSNNRRGGGNGGGRPFRRGGGNFNRGNRY